MSPERDFLFAFMNETFRTGDVDQTQRPADLKIDSGRVSSRRTTLKATNGRVCLFIDIRTRESATLATIHGEDRPLLTSKPAAKHKQEENQENSRPLGENRKKSAENLLSGRLAE